MDGLRVHTPEVLRAFAEDVRLSPGLETGGTVFLTGMVAALRGEGPEAGRRATADAFDDVESILTEAGLGWEEVVDVTSFHTDLRAHGRPSSQSGADGSRGPPSRPGPRWA